MFTIEHDEDETIITILDHEGDLEDVGVLMYEDRVFIRQWNEHRQQFDLIAMNAHMYYKLMQAWSLPEGTYVVERKNV
tara:strand:- start:254 stop:487 length:234 start_codon:yes stop_codon:yes gene_type:complete